MLVNGLCCCGAAAGAVLAAGVEVVPEDCAGAASWTSSERRSVGDIVGKEILDGDGSGGKRGSY